MAGYVLMDDGPEPQRKGYILLDDDAPAKKESPSFGKWLNSEISNIPRQIGLTGRYALEGPAQALQIFTEPVAGLMRAAGTPTKPLSKIATEAADWMGLPSPQNSQERVVGDAARLVAGAGGMLGASQQVAKLPGMIGKAGGFLAENPVAQLNSASGAGMLGGISREAGGNEWQQAGASLLGGVAGGAALPLLGKGVSKITAPVRNALSEIRGTAMTPQQIEVKIQNAVNQGGGEYGMLPEKAQQAMRIELQKSLRAGRGLDPEATARLAEFRALGVTPTRGMVTQDPAQITREMNLAKTGANSADNGLQGLARIQNQNNNKLIGLLNDSGAKRGDSFSAGQQSIAGIASENAAREAAKTAAYRKLEGMPGYRAPMAPNALSNINAALGEEAAMPFMPKEISSYMGAFLQPNGPEFTPQAYNNLQKMLSGASTSQDGNVRNAVRVAAQALENSPIQAANSIPGHVSRQVGDAASDALGQLRSARAANRDWRSWQESAQPIAKALNGMEPDKFVQNFVLNGSVADAKAVSQYAPREAVRDAVVSHLKEKALSGQADEVGKFSASAFNKALNSIGDRKLGLYFDPEELQQLKSVGRVSSLMMNQPVGSAVNNSNSGALLLGRGVDSLKHIPIIGPNFGPAMQNWRISVQQRAAQKVLPGLLVEQPKESLSRGLLAPAAVYGAGLLSQ